MKRGGPGPYRAVEPLKKENVVGTVKLKRI
jgi:hypothetical protein